MCITEFNRERHETKLRAESKAEGREEGRAEGRKEGRAEGKVEGRAEGMLLNLADLVEDGLLTLTQAAKKAKMTKEKFKAKVAALKKELQLT